MGAILCSRHTRRLSSSRPPRRKAWTSYGVNSYLGLIKQSHVHLLM
jgi:hypothetical protein